MAFNVKNFTAPKKGNGKKAAAKNPDEEKDLTGVNTSPGNMDEDGEEEVDQEEHDANHAAARGALDEDDDSPVISKLTVVTGHLAGAKLPQTDITAEVHGGDVGFMTRRTVLTGAVTAYRLAQTIADIGNW